jgi:phosphatidylserine/phosphatidylglycerophosphate/cardiolipin synthase-like enzyme
MTAQPLPPALQASRGVCLAAVCAVSLLAAPGADAGGQTSAKVEVAFREDCETLCLRAIREAKREIYVAAYSFTRRTIVDALVQRAERGVRLHIKLDAHQAKSRFSENAIAALDRAGIKYERIKMPAYRAMHNKFLVVDRKVVVTGSYNFTSAATEDNWENVVRVDSMSVATSYVDEWKRIASQKK